MKILLTGQSGQVGHELALSLKDAGEVISFSRAQMDLTDLDQIRDVIRATRPDLIVNPAAYTAVVKAEAEPALAHLINAEAPGVMAQEAQRLGAAMIHYSTDYVFDGGQTTPYDEAAATNPLNVYGASKLAGEHAVARHCEAHWILRTSWVYGVYGGNFMKTIIRLAQEQSQFTMTGDQFGAPTWARTISRVTREMLTNRLKDGTLSVGRVGNACVRNTAGTYHLTSAGETSWYEYASFIVDHLLARGVPAKIAGSAAITPIATVTGAGLPTRPKSSRLALNKLESTFKLRLPDWKADATLCLDELIGSIYR
jgi:dTDP-4-dehydrorhamnose reductase